MKLPSKQAAIPAAAIVLAVGGAIVNDSMRYESEPGIDPVVAGFDREIAGEPGAPTRIRRASIEDEVLYQTINTIHLSADAQPSEMMNETALRSDDEAEEE